MKLGAEPKKVAILGTLLAVAAVLLYINVFQSDGTTPAPAPPRPVEVAAAPATAAPAPTAGTPASPRQSGEVPARRREQAKTTVSEFRPRQGYARPEDKPDPATIDPTLRLELLAKVQSVEIAGASRNVFQYGAPPAPKVELPKNPPTIPINNRPPPPAPIVAPIPQGPPPVPTAPPMTFKYYGFKVSQSSGKKEAFLLDGDEIIVAAENDVIKRGKYRVVRIGVNSIVMEDVDFKSQQTLKLQEDAVV